MGRNAHTQRALDSGLVPSMGSVGDCFDNAVIESFWSRMQVELLDRKRWRTRVELANAIFEYLEIFHNRQRRHSALGMLTPAEYEARQSHRHGSMNPITRLRQTQGTAKPPENPGQFTYDLDRKLALSRVVITRKKARVICVPQSPWLSTWLSDMENKSAPEPPHRRAGQ